MKDARSSHEKVDDKKEVTTGEDSEERRSR